MIFTSALSAVFIFMAFYSAIFIRGSLIRYAAIALYLIAIFFVWTPDTTTIIANFFGMTRGLDFILTLLSVSIINGMFFIVRHLNSQHESITKLTRHLAISSARTPNK